MIHPETLKSALAGHLMDAELAEHLRGCPECQAELAALKALETRLANAGRVERDPAWEGALVRSLSVEGALRRRKIRIFRGWLGVAASTLVAAALLTGWVGLSQREGGPGPAVSTTDARAGLAPLSSIDGAWGSAATDVDSTAALLQTCESAAGSVPQFQSAEMEQYLTVHDTGGWDG